MAEELAEMLRLNEVRFIPAANPPHKDVPAISAQQRAAMVQLAIQGRDHFVMDTRELEREGASYTIDTLMSLRSELGKMSASHSLWGVMRLLNLIPGTAGRKS